MKITNKRLGRLTENKSESITDRQERIAGWRQDLMAEGRALIIGAGALGNEVAKKLVHHPVLNFG